MRKRTLVKILHRLFAGLLVIVVVFFITGIGFEIFTANGEIGSFSTTNHHSKGYSLPVSIKTRVYDPIFNNLKLINKKKSKNDSGKEWSTAEVVSFNEMPLNINEGTKNVLRFHFDDKIEYFTTNESIFKANGYIIAKSKNIFIIILQVVKAYMSIILLILIFFFLERIFYRLNKTMSFSGHLYRNVKMLGLVFVFTEAIDLIISYILSTYYMYVDVETLIDGKNLTNGIKLSMNPRLEFEFTLFLVGLSLLVLASLLKAGNVIQQENELTI